MLHHAKFAGLLLDGAAIGSGAFCGALLRYGAMKVQEHYKCGPWAIPVINVAGSFVLGALSVSSHVDPRLKLMMGVGFCGSLTTFSTFSVDIVHLLHAGKLGTAIGYVLFNNVGGVLAAALAIKLFTGKGGFGGGGGLGGKGGGGIGGFLTSPLSFAPSSLPAATTTMRAGMMKGGREGVREGRAATTGAAAEVVGRGTGLLPVPAVGEWGRGGGRGGEELSGGGLYRWPRAWGDRSERP